MAIYNSFEAIESAFREYFSETQIEVIRDTVRYGAWGDTSMEFGSDPSRGHSAYGYFTSDAKIGGRFSGKQLSGYFSGISKAITEKKCPFVTMFPDWWGDGKKDCDMLFINLDLMDSTELDKWAIFGAGRSDENVIKSNIKEWYTAEYPTDEVAEDIDPSATFEGLFEALDRRGDVYSYIFGDIYGDSVIRERIFERLAKIIGMPYSYVYDQWLLGSEGGSK